MGLIRTVTGAVEAAGIVGACLAHEHLWIDLRNQAAKGATERAVAAADHAALMVDPYSMRDNLWLDDAAAAEAECRRLRELGCALVVDCSTPQIGRAPRELKRLSERTGMRIVMGCGYYTADTWPEGADTPAEALAEALVQECREGVEGIQPGVLGEFGTSRELLPQERRALEAAAMAYRATGLGVQVHIYPWCTNGLEAAAILQRGGVPPEKTVICHSDVAPDRAYILRLLRQGVFVEFDNFGKEFTPAPGASFAGGRFCPDTERAALFAELVRGGWAKQLLATNDICLKCMLGQCGGKGYAHIFEGVTQLLEADGLPPQEWQPQILHDNPLRLLAL